MKFNFVMSRILCFFTAVAFLHGEFYHEYSWEDWRPVVISGIIGLVWAGGDLMLKYAAPEPSKETE